MPQDGEHTTLDSLETDLLAEISAATVLKELEAVRISALGKKGRVSGLMQKIATRCRIDRMISPSLPLLFESCPPGPRTDR